MNQATLNTVRLFCPGCRKSGADTIVQYPLALSSIFQRDGDHIIEGMLTCTGNHCGRSYPIVHGVPIILKNMHRWWQAEQGSVKASWGDASTLKEYFADLEGVCKKTDMAQNALSSAIEFHYDAPVNAPPLLAENANGDRFWNEIWQLIQTKTGAQPRYRAALDLGCSVGGWTGKCAKISEISVGIDMNFSAVAFAEILHRKGEASWNRKLRGCGFQKEKATAPRRHNVLFLVADALDPPFEAGAFDLVSGLNLIDCVDMPLFLLGQMNALLNQGGNLLLGAPYEWRDDICEMDQWLERKEMDAPNTIKSILQGMLMPETGFLFRILAEKDRLPWVLRNHDRYWSVFLLHLLLAEKLSPQS